MVRLGGVGMVLGFSLALTCIWALGGLAPSHPPKTS